MCVNVCVYVCVCVCSVQVDQAVCCTVQNFKHFSTVCLKGCGLEHIVVQCSNLSALLNELVHYLLELIMNKCNIIFEQYHSL